MSLRSLYKAVISTEFTKLSFNLLEEVPPIAVLRRNEMIRVAFTLRCDVAILIEFMNVEIPLPEEILRLRSRRPD